MRWIALTLSISCCLLFANHAYCKWIQTDLGHNVNINALGVSGSAIFVGTDTYGMFLSTNNGISWVKTGFPARTVTTFVVNDNNIFASTDSGVYLSINNGASWTPVNNWLTNEPILAFAVSNNNYFAATRSQVFLYGASWTAMNFSSTDDTIASLAVNGDNILVGTDDTNHMGGYGIYLSSDKGGSWIPSKGQPGTKVEALAVSDNKIFAGTAGSGVYVTSNNGASWTYVDAGLPGNFLFVKALAASGKNIVAGTSYGVFLSTNNGASWLNIGLENQMITAVAISGTNIFAGTTGEGVWRESFSELHKGPSPKSTHRNSKDR